MSQRERFWEDAWNRTQPTITGIRKRLSELPFNQPRIVRVGQLDAELLDQELLQVLKQPLTTSLSLIKSTLAARFDLEISLLLQVLLYKYSVWETGATYGAKLQDLRFQRKWKSPTERYTASGLPRRILLRHVFITIILPYIHSKIRAHGLSHSWPDAPQSDSRRRFWELLVSVEAIQTAIGLTGFISFLFDGRYRSLTDRLLGLRLVPAQRVVARNVNYEFMNRQMVWHAFTEFLLFILPLINVRLLKRRITQNFRKVTALISRPDGSIYGAAPKTSLANGKRGKYAGLSGESCSICAENAESADMKSAAANPGTVPTHTESVPGLPAFPINVPYKTSCGHVFCYHCITEHMLQAADDGDAGWECNRCTEIVTSANRVEEEVTVDDSDALSDPGSLIESADLRSSMESH